VCHVRSEMLVRVQLGRACTLARQRAGLRQADVAERAGVDRSTVSRLEAGLHMVESVETLVEAYELLCDLPDGELWRRALGCDDEP
jgi:transcriptional regulator with XRE-family HTH domain